MPDAVLLDLDGLLIESEQIWDHVRRAVARDHGVGWTDDATLAMQGMSAPEWTRYMVDVLGVPLGPEEVNTEVVDALLAHYDEALPILPCAVDAVSALATRWPLGLASSSNRELIDHVLERSGLAACFAATVSSEEVPHGKPAPDVYLEVARRLATSPSRCVAVEDSTNGIRSAVAAGASVIAVPNRHFAPDAAVLADARVVLPTLCDLTVALVDEL